jgi:hypothetical protein
LPLDIVVDLGTAEATETYTVDLIILISREASKVVPSTTVPTKIGCQLYAWPRQGLEEEEEK